MSENLPKRYVEKHRTVGESSKIFDVPVSKLTREELYAVIGHLIEQNDSQREEYKRDMGFLNELKC